MEKRERIERVVIGAIRQMNSPVIPVSTTGDIRAIALSDHLDSIEMVNLIISVEAALRKEFSQEVPILGRKNALGRDPFKTAGSLMDYIGQII